MTGPRCGKAAGYVTQLSEAPELQCDSYPLSAILSAVSPSQRCV